MTESENLTLYADEFTPADQPFLTGLLFGDEAWSKAATEWITSSEVLDSIENHQTKVWIYRNAEADGSIVGFSSLAATGWQKWPPPDGKRSRLLYIPQVGLAQKYRGFPPDPDWRYSNQIMGHLIGQAKKLAVQIREGKPIATFHALSTTRHAPDDVLRTGSSWAKAQ